MHSCKQYILALSGALLLLASAVLCYTNGLFPMQRPFASMDAKALIRVDIQRNPPGTTFAATQPEQLARIADAISSLTFLYPSDRGSTMVGQYVEYTLTFQDGMARTVGVYGTYARLDGVWYRVKYEPSEALNALGNELAH